MRVPATHVADGMHLARATWLVLYLCKAAVVNLVMRTVVTHLATAVVGSQAFLVVLALYKAPETKCRHDHAQHYPHS